MRIEGHETIAADGLRVLIMMFLVYLVDGDTILNFGRWMDFAWLLKQQQCFNLERVTTIFKMDFGVWGL